MIFAFIYCKISKKERLALSALKKTESENTTEVSITDLIKQDSKHRFVSLEKFKFNKSKNNNNDDNSQSSDTLNNKDDLNGEN